MKIFTHPEGIFTIKIPIEWQYKNIAVGYEEKSPFSFELYEKSIGCFQISCYHENEKAINEFIKPQRYNTDDLKFVEQRIDEDGFNIHLWYSVIEDHVIMAKYIYDTEKSKTRKVKDELKKVQKSLKSLRLLAPDLREDVVDIEKYVKFMASLAASFDLLNKAYERDSVIEIVVIVASQIDAYLRIAIVMTKQLNEKTNQIDISLLHQRESDRPVTERTIYRTAHRLKIIDDEVFNHLMTLYDERNKMIHRYIISDFKTRDIRNLSIGYVKICEVIRLIIEEVEDEQLKKQIGICRDMQDSRSGYEPDDISLLHSQVNDKHLISSLKRKVVLSRKI